jgi:hypothetical protein
MSPSFRRKPELERPETPVQVKATPEEIRDALENSLIGIEHAGVDRVTIGLFESDPDIPLGRWLESEGDQRYYPFDFLLFDEQKMILDAKSYTSVNLVGRSVWMMRNYTRPGIELVERKCIHPGLPPQTEESQSNYVTRISCYTPRNFAEQASDSGWTSEGVYQSVQAGIDRYYNLNQDIMSRLVTLEFNLKLLDSRKGSLMDKIFDEVREQIRSAKK